MQFIFSVCTYPMTEFMVVRMIGNTRSE